MTHTSWLNEAGRPERSDNERLEFLGDAVLDLVVSDVLMRRFPDRREGDLSRARAALVSESGLAQVALAIDLGRFILLGKGEERTGGRVASVDPRERAGGADGGDLHRRRASTPSPRSRRGCSRRASKTWIRTRGSTTSRACRSARRRCWQTAPVYEVVAEDGPDHDKRFEVALSLAGRPYGRAVGRSKKEAEQGAAAAALEALEREETGRRRA